MTTNNSFAPPAAERTAKATRSLSDNHPPDAAISSEVSAPLNSTRPIYSKGWKSERPSVAKRSSILTPALSLQRTNTSALNHAIWESPSGDTPDFEDSSSSSSEDEDSKVTKAKPGKHQRRVSGKGQYSRFNVGNEDYSTSGKVSKRDGRLNISVNETNNRGYLAKALGATFLKRPGPSMDETEKDNERSKTLSRSSSTSTRTDEPPRPKLNIVVMVIGSRGDIQPFLKLGKDLKEFGHRVRIATHPAFKDFVQKDSGLEFFSVGGDPAELMAFMVKNPGMIPTMDTLKKGEVGRRRDQMAEMFEGFWRACINATDDETDPTNLKMMGEKSPFVADAIIANPPSFAHVHCAERLGIPLHLMFTFPYTPTQAFPHPLANIKKTNVDPGYANFMSYPLVEMMTWQGLGDLVNDFRVKTLGLEPVSTLWAPGQLYRLKVPYTYLWSPGLVPKPKDWGPEIDIAGFVFLDLASSFKPPDDLAKFLEDGEPPIYIGFGSIVVDDPDKFTEMIFEAVKKAGVRALVSKGWGGLGGDSTPDNVFMLENTPHDWLFPKVKAVIHHGGAGTTAIGLKCGKPTMVVPFFGDQQFWGAMIAASGAGAKPVPYKDLTADKLVEGIKELLTDEASEAAAKIAESIEAEGDGAKNAVKSFHRSLTLRGLNSMRCSILEDRVATWKLKNTNLRLSALAAELLVEKKRVSWKQLRLIRHLEWNDFEGPGEPISGGATAIMGNLTSMATGIGGIPFKITKTSKRHARHEERKKRKAAKKELKKGGKSDQETSNSNSNGHSTPQQHGTVAESHEIAQSDSDRQVERQTTEAKDYAVGDSAPKEKTTIETESKDHATAAPNMGSHTSQGEPVAQNHDANREQEKMNEEEDNDSVLSDDPDAAEWAQDVGGGLGKTAGALARMPMDLSLAVAQGFHNAPRLYGDTTVRRPTRITGMKSGLKAAGQEFVFGIYDGFSGLVIQPYIGARDNGPVGFVKGVGMGLTGFVLKDIAAILGPFGYTFKGVHKELLKNKQPTHFIRKARIMQGQRDLRACDEKERKTVIATVDYGWSVVQEVWAIMNEKRAQGLKGRALAMRERKTWRTNGAFENVKMAKKAVEARRRGEELDDVFAEQKRELEKVRKPRRNVVHEMEQQKKASIGNKKEGK